MFRNVYGIHKYTHTQTNRVVIVAAVEAKMIVTVNIRYIYRIHFSKNALAPGCFSILKKILGDHIPYFIFCFVLISSHEFAIE